MPIRVYMCKWQLVGNRVVNPVMEASESQTGLDWCSAHYPPALPDGTPNKDFCMVLVKSTDFSVLDALPAVDKLPRRALNRNLPGGTKNNLGSLLESNFSFPPDFMDDITTGRSLVDKIAKEIHPDFVTMGIGDHIGEDEFA